MSEQDKCPNCGAPMELHEPGTYAQEEWCDYATSLRSKLRNMEHVMQTLHSQRLSGKLGLEGTAILEMLSGETGVFVAELEVQHDLALKRAEALARAKERDTIAEEDNE